MIDITQFIGAQYYEMITKTDGSQVFAYNLPWIANAILTFIMFIGFFAIISNFQKVWSRKGAK